MGPWDSYPVSRAITRDRLLIAEQGVSISPPLKIRPRETHQGDLGSRRSFTDLEPNPPAKSAALEIRISRSPYFSVH